jgi:O-antigen/teichoic acid export membrane protein
MTTEQNVAALPSAGLSSAMAPRPLRSSLVLSGSLVMLMGSVVVSLLNFGYNVGMARMLGPAEFGHVSAVATLLMLGSAITLSFQLVCAKFVARNNDPRSKERVYRDLMRRAGFVGIVVGAGIAGFGLPIAHLLKLPSPWLIAVLGIGLAFAIPLGVKRGGLQGLCAFPRLAGNFVLEAAVKFALAMVLVSLGYGIFGAVGAISAGAIAAFVAGLVRFGAPAESQATTCIPASFHEGMQMTVFFVGQVVINNIDILLVKYFFPPAEAGMYAAVALFGRLLYFASWNVVSAMFPISAATPEKDGLRRVLVTPLLMVLGMSIAYIALLALLPNFLLDFILGHSFAAADSLLPYYATATGLYSISVVLMAYEMSRKIANTGWLQLLFSGLLVLGISLFHNSLKEVVEVQILLMFVLLTLVSLPFLRNWRSLLRQPEAA